MKKQYLINQAVRFALMTGTAAIVAGYASTASAANANTPAQLGKVTVTGSRIKRTNIETAQPTTRISRQQIQQSGYTNLGDLLRQLSFSGPVVNTSVNFAGNGATHVNLHNLGPKRTLVLVDGKRWLPGLDGTTNLNTIPTSIIDHMEILQDGASAVYGSDAIAGVINIITIKNYNGAEAHARYGIHQADDQGGVWDGQEKQYDFTVGSGNHRGNVTFNATYREQNPIFNSERNISKVKVPGLGSSTGSSSTPRGRFEIQGSALGGQIFGRGQCAPYDRANRSYGTCDLTLINAPAAPSLQNFKNFTPQDRYNFAPANYLQDPLKDVSLYVQGHYDLFDNVTFTANAEYVRDESVQQLAANASSLGAATSTMANGKLVSIAADQKYNPFGIALVSDSSDPCVKNGTCEQLTFLGRRQLEAGPRITSRNRDNFHIFAGFNGYLNLLNREVDWDFGFAQNRVQRTDLYTGSFDTQRLATALGSPSQCNSPCVPFNFFGGSVVGGGGSITQDQLGYTLVETHNVTQTNLRDWTANLSSDVYDLPAGPLGVAIGYERLDAYGYYKPDALVAAGETGGTVTNPTNGRVVTDAEYAELNIPLLADLPGVKSLSVDVANRWSQFRRSGGVTGQNESTFVHNSSGRLNIRYQVINDLLLRASWSQGFRAPNISELFAGQHGSGAGLADPCAPPPGSYNGGALPQNCPNETPDLQSNTQVHTTVGGNPDLQPESSISRTVGFVYSPSQLPGLDINADYFKIELTSAVSTVGSQNILNSCFFNSTLCNLVTVRSNHVTDIRNISTNIGSELIEGTDIGLHYKFPSTSIGDFDARINGTFLKTFDRTVLNLSTRTGFATSHLAGVDEYAKRRFNGYLNWDYGNLSAHYHIEYIDSVVEPCQEALNLCTYPNRTADYQGTRGQFNGGRNHLGATVYHDINVAYALPQLNTTISVGVRNLFDKIPPISRVPHTNNYNVYLYRLPSRFIYGDIRVKF